MLRSISEILLSFSLCFSRTAAFEWFVVIVIGFMVRSDPLGVTSVIRDLALDPRAYPCLIHFFHASSWGWDAVFYQWVQTVAAHTPLHKISGRTVLIGTLTKTFCLPLSIQVHELFHSAAASFQSAKLPMYGSDNEVRYLSRIYLWGQKLYQPLQFVFNFQFIRRLAQPFILLFQNLEKLFSAKGFFIL